MELLAIVKDYNLSLSRSEKSLVDLLPGSTSEQTEQRMKMLAEARDVLKQLPDRQTSERRSRMEKAAMLKERLKMLKQMLPFLSPSAAKSLKSEMKQIAGQIATLSGGSGGGSGGTTFTTGISVGGTVESAQQESEVSAGTDREEDSQQESAALSDSGEPGQDVKSDAGGATEERQLKEAVAELKTLFKTLLEALKRKQKTGGILRDDAALRAYVNLPDSGGNVAVNV
jgi:hypothetical protein